MSDVFRVANERIRATAVEQGMSTLVPFICECPDGRCTQIVQTSVAEFDAICGEPQGRMLASGHLPGDEGPRTV